MSVLDPELDTAVPETGGSVLDRVRARREQIAESATPEKLMEVPQYDGALGVWYRYPQDGADPIIRASMRAQTSDDPVQMLNTACDVLIACCHQIVGRVPDGEWEPIDGEQPVTFTRRLADLLQIPVPDGDKGVGRFILRNVFSPRAVSTGVYDGDLGLMIQAGQIVEWLQVGAGEANERVRGE